MSHEEHEALAAKKLRVGVLTLSDTRTVENDHSGQAIRGLLIESGHSVPDYGLIREDPETIHTTFSEWLEKPLDAIISNGGTGLSGRDGTIEVVERLFHKTLPGFGELFRLISFHQIGPAAMLSRATAGTAKGKVVICLPGSSRGVTLAMRRILLPQLPHMVWECGR